MRALNARGMAKAGFFLAGSLLAGSFMASLGAYTSAQVVPDVALTQEINRSVGGVDWSVHVEADGQAHDSNDAATSSAQPGAFRLNPLSINTRWPGPSTPIASRCGPNEANNQMEGSNPGASTFRPETPRTLKPALTQSQAALSFPGPKAPTNASQERLSGSAGNRISLEPKSSSSSTSWCMIGGGNIPAASNLVLKARKRGLPQPGQSSENGDDPALHAGFGLASKSVFSKQHFSAHKRSSGIPPQAHKPKAVASEESVSSMASQNNSSH